MIFEWRVHSDPGVERRARFDRVRGANFRNCILATNVLMVRLHLASSDPVRMVDVSSENSDAVPATGGLRTRRFPP